MSERIILTKTPIVEAVMQVNLAPVTLWDKTLAGKFAEEHLSEYRFDGELIQEQVDLVRDAITKPPEQIAHSRHWGGNRYSKGGNNIVIVYPNAIAFSNLPPYPTEKDRFYNEALDVVTCYMSEMLWKAPVTRVGLRFINRFECSQVFTEVAEKFESFPAALTGFSNEERGSFLYQDSYRRKIQGCGKLATAVVTRVFPVADPDSSMDKKLVLDIDASVAPQIEINEATLRIIINELRAMKNAVFFGSLTEKALEEYI